MLRVVTLVTPAYPLLPLLLLLPLVTPWYSCYPLLPLLPLVTPWYSCYPLLLLVTPVTPWYPRYPCYPPLPLVTPVTPWLISWSINYWVFQLSVSCIIGLCHLEIILPFSLNIIVNLSSSYSLIIAFSSNPHLCLRLRFVTSTMSAITLSTACITTRYYCYLLHRN